MEIARAVEMETREINGVPVRTAGASVRAFLGRGGPSGASIAALFISGNAGNTSSAHPIAW